MASILIRNTSFLFRCRRCIPLIQTKFNNKFHLNTKIIEHPKIGSTRNIHLSSCLENVVSFNLSDIGEGIREVTIKEWFVKEGDTVEQFDNLCEVQSDKASVTITSRYDGKILKIYHKIDEIAYVGKPLIDFEIENDDGSDTDDTNENKTDNNEKKSQNLNIDINSQENQTENYRNKVLATPAVRRIAIENKIDLKQVPATGKLGRVLKGDVLEYLGIIPAGTNIPHPTLQMKETKKDDGIENLTNDRIEILKGIRKVMLKSMTESLKIPHFAYCDEINMANLIEIRNNLSNEAIKYGIQKLTFMPFCIKATSLALKHYPILNSSLDLNNESVTYKHAHNISVAIDTPDGLVVPNVKNCQNKTILQIARDLQELTERARKNTLKPNDCSDGTFSLSNIGILGGTYTHPCILPPQVAIGAMGRTKVVPRFDENENLIKAHIMCVSWCADHRVIDGVTMAKFSNLWKNYLENPLLFLLD